MADISKIKVNGVTYDINDQTKATSAEFATLQTLVNNNQSATNSRFNEIQETIDSMLTVEEYGSNVYNDY